MLEQTQTALRRLAGGKSIQPPILVGLRGVGKTVLLVTMQEMAQAEGFIVVAIEACEGRSFAELIAPGLRAALQSLSMIEAAKEKAKRALGVLKSFMSGFNLAYAGVELSFTPTVGVADSGSLEADLPELLVELGDAAAAANRPVVIFVDELQVLKPIEFSALIMAIHKINQKQLPLAFIGAGLPQVLGLAGNSKSYSERLFVFPEIGALREADALAAIVNPAAVEKVEFEADAISEILRVTERYPYFLQQWAHDSWNIAQGEKITWSDVLDAYDISTAALDRSFFRVRYDRCRPAEQGYMRALAELGAGVRRSVDLAELLGKKVDAIAPTRASLIKKGMIFAPSIGEVCFTVPMFDAFMKRVLPSFPPSA